MEKIPLQANCSFSRPIPVSDPDLCVIFGNLLENAIEAQQYLPEEKRNVQILSHCDESGFSLAIDNAFDGTLMKDVNTFLSRKQEGRSGIGVQSVKAICDKYDGTFLIQTEDNVYKAGIVIARSADQA